MTSSTSTPKASPRTTQRRRGIAGSSALGGAFLLLIAGVVVLRLASTKNNTANAVESSLAATPVKDNVRIATLLPFAADQLIALGVEPVCVPKLDQILRKIVEYESKNQIKKLEIKTEKKIKTKIDKALKNAQKNLEGIMNESIDADQILKQIFKF